MPARPRARRNAKGKATKGLRTKNVNKNHTEKSATPCGLVKIKVRKAIKISNTFSLYRWPFCYFSINNFSNGL